MVVTMGHRIIVSPDSPFTIDNIPFGVIKTAKESTPRCASAIGDYAIDLSLYAQWRNLDTVKEDIDLTDIFSQVILALPIFLGGQSH
jgi:fumarylacetoacetase